MAGVIRRWVPAAVLLVGLVLVWEWAARRGALPVSVAGPDAIRAELVRRHDALWFHTGPTIAAAARGYVLATVAAFALALVVVGDNQDELSGECRWVVKALRQKAGLLMAVDAKMTPIATEIRAKTQDVLRNPANHEGARH